MRISEIIKRRVAIGGYGSEGRSVARALRRAGYDRPLLVVADAPPDIIDANDHQIVWLSAEDWPTQVSTVDVLVASPGLAPHHPILVTAEQAGLAITTATNVYIETVRAADLPVIGVTGSKGKSTCATLIQLGLQACGQTSYLVGNIGQPALDMIDQALRQRAITVFELSSYQCARLTLGPSIAVLLSLFPEHLDWHGSLAAYYASKCQIAATQKKDDVCIYNATDQEIVARLPLGPGQQVPFGTADRLHVSDRGFFDGPRFLFADQLSLRGRHNRSNVCAALTVIKQLGFSLETAIAAMNAFAGLPHRLEDLGLHGGIHWIDDSISTAPEAAEAALEAYGDAVDAMIIGGYDRGYAFDHLAQTMASSSVRHVAILPPSGLRFAEALQRCDSNHKIMPFIAQDLPAAVAWLRTVVPRSRICLLSPASPSYGAYANFQQRGEHFRRLVSAL